jgi:flagella basal body P-ring formation protein FlgA
MRHRRAILLLATIVLAASATIAGDASDKEIKVYLPRERTVETSKLTLGQIALVSCDNDKTANAAEGIALGRAPWKGENIVLDRKTILSRLASSGLDADDVLFSGAMKVTVKRDETTIDSERIITVARKYLAANKPAGEGSFWSLVRKPQDLIVQSPKGVKLSASVADRSPSGCAKVIVRARRGEKDLGKTEVLFRRGYLVQKVVATKDIEAGEKLSTDNATVVTIESLRPADGKFAPPWGMVATNTIRKGREVRDNLLRSPAQKVIVKRGQGVEMRIEGEGFAVRASGQALQDGKPGEFIKVRNIDTRRIVVAKVNPDGYVVPVLKR